MELIFICKYLSGLCYILLFSVTYFSKLGACQYDYVSRLVRELRIDYEKHVPPTKTRESHVTVKVYPTIIRINDLDVDKEALSATISLSMSWSDERLAWNPAQHGGVTRVFIPASALWLPDINVHNTINAMGPEMNSPLLEVSHIGNVIMVSVLDAYTYCHVNLTNFPRDIHECDIVIAKHVLLEFWQGNEGLVPVPIQSDTDPALPTRDGRTWELMGRTGSAFIKLVTYDCCPDEPYAQLRLSVTLRRHAPFFTQLVYLSLVALSLLVPFQFLIPAQHNHRPVVGVILVCSQFVFLHTLLSYIPDSAGTPLIGKLVLADMVVGTVAVILSVLIINLGNTDHHRNPLPAFLNKLINSSKCCHDNDELSATRDELKHLNNTCAANHMEITELNNLDSKRVNLQNMVREIKETISAIYKEKQKVNQLNETWKSVARFLDKLCFLLFFIVLIVNILLICI